MSFSSIINVQESNHRYRPATAEDLDKIHQATCEVLETTGFEILEPSAFRLFRDIADSVDSEKRVVTLKESTIKDLISNAPSVITLYGRKEGQDVTLGAGKVHYGTGGTALNIHDYENNDAKPAKLKDLADVARLVDVLENIHLLLLPTYPNEIEFENIDVNRFLTGLVYTSKHIMGGVYTKQGIQDVIAMAEEIAGSPEALRERPIISMIACGISPLRLDSKYGAFMMEIAKQGIPLAVPVEPLCGATSPATLAGNLLIQNCDSLINVMLTQLVNPGTPVIYGCVATSTDMRDLGYLGGPVESGMLNAGAAQLAQYYGLPYYGTAGISDSKTLDAQSGYESAINNLLVGLAGGDFIHDAAGLMEFAMTVSREKLVIDNEILGMVLRAVRGIEVNDDTLATELIKKVGPGGNFIATRHTRKNLKKEHYRPQLSNRDKRKVWKSNGALTTAEAAHEKVTEILGQEPKHYLGEELVSKFAQDYPGLDDSFKR